MDLSRTVYSRDLKIAAMRAVDVGAMMAEIARKYQVSPHMRNAGEENGGSRAISRFPAWGVGERICRQWRRPGGWPSWSARSANSRWRTIF